MSKDEWKYKDPNRIEYHFKEMCKQMGLDLDRIPEHELLERKKVFWAAWGQCQLQLMGNLTAGHEPKFVIDQARDQVRQVSVFFTELTHANEN